MTSSVEKNRKRLIIATFAASWMLRLLIAWAGGCFHNFDRRDMERLALGLVDTGTISNMMVPGVPSAGEAPGYVLILAAIFKLFGRGLVGEIVKVVTCTATSSLRNALTVWLAIRLRLPAVAVVFIAVLSVFWIGALNTELQGDWDPPYTACALILLAWFTHSKPLEGHSTGSAIMLGAAWALASYFNFCILAVLGGFLVRDFLRRWRQDFARIMRQSICVILGIFLALAPWAIRNRITLGGWVLTRSMLGYGLMLSYHDGAVALEPINNHPGLIMPGHPDSSLVSPYPFLNPSLRPEVARLGEVAWDHKMREKGLNWMAAHPEQTLNLMAQHAYYYWFPPGPSFYEELRGGGAWAYSVAKWILTLLAIAGWIRLHGISPPAAGLIGIIALWFPLIYYLVNWSSRYRMPMEWVLVLLAGVALAWIYEAVLPRSAAVRETMRTGAYSGGD
jgi:hypothetical protein